MRVVYYGRGVLATPAFEALLRSSHEVVALVAEVEPDEGAGPEVPAGASRIPVLAPVGSANPETEETVRHLAPDLQVMVGYRGALPGAILRLPREGTVKIHPSLLPRYRGEEPVRWAILNGDRETGVTALLVEQGRDAGPDSGRILLAHTTEIAPEETAAELTARLAQLAADLLMETLEQLVAGHLTPLPQSGRQASEAPPLDPGLSEVDWSLPADVLARRIRALNPTPGVRSQLQGTSVRLLRAVPLARAPGEQGVVQSAGYDGLVVGCGGKTALRLTQLQVEGLRSMSPSAFIARLRIQRGDRFD